MALGETADLGTNSLMGLQALLQAFRERLIDPATSEVQHTMSTRPCLQIGAISHSADQAVFSPLQSFQSSWPFCCLHWKCMTSSCLVQS